MIFNKILYITGILLFFSCKEKKQETQKQFSETDYKTIAPEKNDTTLDPESLYPITAPSNEVIIDSLVFDFNNDQIKDKILIRANPKEQNVIGDEYFDHIDSYNRTLDILIGGNNNNYTLITSNKNIIPCLRCNEPMNAYSDFKRVGKNSFSVDVIEKADNMIYQLLFEWRQNNFYLTQIGVKSFYDENSKIIKLKHSININEMTMNSISEYINQK